MDTLRWGILGTGGIARKFAAQLPKSDRGTLVAVASRQEEAAIAFANEFGGAPRSPYAGLLADPHVEAVYNSLPNSLHAEWTIRALESGKHVLCEKPIAATAAEARDMFAAAERTGCTLVEAFMYRGHPAVQRFLALVREGAIGPIKLIRSNFTFQRDADPLDVRYQPLLAGGSIMDVGCYCVNFARAIAGSEPNETHAIAHLYDTGVDEYAAGLLKFDDDVLCTFTCGMTIQSDLHTFVAGRDGHLAIDSPWFSGGKFTLVRRGEKPETITVDASSNYYAAEADAFAATVLDGAPPAISPQDSIGNMVALDGLRRSAGLAY
jgi:predicted dehydrogenase